MSPTPHGQSAVVDNETNTVVQERTDEPEATGRYLKFSRMVLVAVVLCLATLCVALDNTIISTAVPRITHDFKSIDDVGWYASVYPLASCAFQPSYGKVYTIFSNKIVFLSSLLIFEIGSVVCATAPRSYVLIIGRAIAGLGSAGIQAGTTLILAECVPLPQRPTWNSIIGSFFAIGSVVGPLLGGAFSQANLWRWCFFINLPIGGVVMLFIAFFYDGKRGGERDVESIGFRRQVARFDLPGIITFVSATIALLLALSWGGTTYPWSDKRIIALFVLAGVLYCSFIGVERWRKDSAVIPLRLLRRRSMTAAIVFGICLGGVFFVNVYYIPLWFQLVEGVPAIESAVLFIPFMLSVVGGFMLAGFGTAATGYYTPFVYAGTILMSISTGLLMTVQPRDTSRAKWVGFQILCGLGIGLGEEQGLYMVQTTIPEADVPTGIGIVLFAQTFGGALFVSVAQTVFLTSITESLAKVAPHMNPLTIVNHQAASLSKHSDVAPGLQAIYGMAIKDALRVGLILATVSSLGAVLYDWKSLKVKSDDSSSGESASHELEQTRAK